MSSKQQGVGRRLGKAFLLQAVYISVAVVVGLAAVTVVVEDILIKQALKGEADFYWDRAAKNQDHTLPETRNMISYRDGHGEVPVYLVGMEPGFNRIEEPRKALALVTERNGERLYQVFNTVQVGWLIRWFGIVPLATVLAGVYMALFQAYRVSRSAVSPIVDLSKRVKQLDPANPDVALFATSNNMNALDTDEEFHTLNSAMQDLTQRLVEFVKREFDFTRDASHELRSPLTVIKIASESLAGSSDNMNDSQRRTLGRIQKAAKDMEELTEAFLLLARESNQSLPADWISVNEVVENEIERAQILVGEKRVSISQVSEENMTVKAPEKVLSSVVGNLLRNGVNYTDEGAVTVTVSRDGVTIKDSGPGMDPDELEQVFKPFNRGKRDRQRGGFGVGLTIVKRLCERFTWPLSIESTVGVGTTVTVSLPQAKSADV
ncbi:MAG: sensor histidine kinase [Gammaproteobacteria bacterium]